MDAVELMNARIAEIERLTVQVNILRSALEQIARATDGYVSESPIIRLAYSMAGAAQDALDGKPLRAISVVSSAT